LRYAGIDIGSTTHYVALVNEDASILRKGQAFGEDGAGYGQLLEWLGEPEGLLVAMEATGHYWQNLFAALVSRGYAVSLVNPTRTRRFADEELMRAKTDKIDAQLIARFAAQKKLSATRIAEGELLELKELVGLRDRLVQDLGDRERQLHRAVDLAFPEFTSHVKDLSSHKATTLLREHPSAKAFAEAPEGKLANLKYGDNGHRVGRALASALIATAKVSVGAHQGDPYRLQIQYFCEDIATLRERIELLDGRIQNGVSKSEVCRLIATIDGIGPHTAARIVER
jgi:transposase